MAKKITGQGYPTAAYLYVLHLDGPGLAWEYLRRNPDYRKGWRRRTLDAQPWGLRLFEDPDLDARDAHPAWYPDHDGVVQLYPDADPPPGALSFALWRIPGSKHLVHDGRRLILLTRWPGGCLRMALMPALSDGMACVYAFRACTAPCNQYRTVIAELGKWTAVTEVIPVALALPRPSPTALLELHTLQALDATLAGASLRETAVEVFGAAAVVEGWHADSGLRAKIRRLVRRGTMLMSGGYRCLAQPETAGKGRVASLAERP